MLKQAKEILEKDFDYHVVYANPLAESFDELLSLHALD